MTVRSRFAVSLTAWLVVTLIPTVPAWSQKCTTTSPPKDAVVLFDGDDTSPWVTRSGGACPWPVEDGAMVVRGEDVVSKEKFGDHQLHIEFRVPPKPDPEVRGWGNSGVYLHGDYELQVIDSFGMELDAGYSCGAVFGQAAPTVNASLPAGEWQSFDVFFRAPGLDEEGTVTWNARLSVLQNGIWIYHDREIDTTPGGLGAGPKAAGPLLLQQHGYPVRYRNIWVRPLDSEE